jgi:hypothetical protein
MPNFDEREADFRQCLMVARSLPQATPGVRSKAVTCDEFCNVAASRE